MSENKTYIQPPREYDQCPRCGSEWAEQIFKPTKMNRPLPIKEGDNCIRCGMRYCYAKDQDNSPLLVSPFVLGTKDYYLAWYLKTRECAYGSSSDVVNGTLIHLPWQPFDITPDKLTKLKIYLTFK
jgi:hypothetical protein